MKAEHKYTRNGKTITTHGDENTPDQVETFSSINAAKRKSRELQGTTMGSGILHTVKTVSKLTKKPQLAKKPKAQAAVPHNPRPTAVEQGQQVKIKGKKPVVSTKPKRKEGA